MASSVGMDAVSRSCGDAVYCTADDYHTLRAQPYGLPASGARFSAFNAWKRGRDGRGRFLLRLEDIDPTRCRPEYAAAIQEDLAWLGLDWDGPPRVQSEHLAEYRAVLENLSERGLIYPCFCTRADIAREVSLGRRTARTGRRPAVSGDVPALSRAERVDRIAAGERSRCGLIWRRRCGRA